MRRRQRVIRSQRRQLLSAMQLLEERYLLAFTTDLFADINQFGVSANPDSLTPLGAEIFFVADDGSTGGELWKSDGTAGGTVQVADINPGPEGSIPSYLTVLGSDLFFTAIDAEGDFDLWKTDGTSAGTVRVFDADAAGVYELDNLTASGSRLFFTAYESSTGYELWSYDGTTGGTAIVLDINDDQSVGEGPQQLTDVGGKLFFTSYYYGYDNRELWESDGTMSGTVLVSDVDGDPLESSDPRHLTNIGGELYFAAEELATGVELYKSTGANGTTARVADISPGLASSYPENLTEFNGQLFFTADDGMTGIQLFKSDGSSVTLVANTTPDGSGSSAPSDLTVVGSELFFVANGDTVPGPVTATQPTMTSDNSRRINSSNYVGLVGALSSLNGGEITTANGIGSFSTPQQGGTSSDGPGWESTTSKIGDIDVGLTNLEIGDFIIRDLDPSELTTDQWEWTISDPDGLSDISFSGFASGNEYDSPDESLLFELFLNGDSTRTSFIEVNGDDLDNYFAGRDADNISLSHPGGETIMSATVRMTFGLDGGAEVLPDAGDEQIVINATLTATGQSSGVAGLELHKTDGTTTTLVKDILTPGSSNPNHLTAVGGQLFFSANDPTGAGRELWVSDGSEANTMLVKDIRPGFDLYGAPVSSEPENLTAFGGQLFFTAVDALNDRELWTSGGTEPTTNQLKNINTGTDDANVQQIVEVGSDIFFVADDGINGEAVWMADPVTGIHSIAADVTGSSSDRVNGLAKFGSGVIFHNDSLGVYTTDGTTTTSLTSRTPIAVDDDGTLFAEVPALGLAFFVVDDPDDGQELWKTNGTEAGTTMVVDLFDGATGSDPRYLVEFQDKLFFAADQRTTMFGTGREVFSSDGTVGGTSVVRDINTDPVAMGAPISLSADPLHLTVSGGLLFFSAESGNTSGNTGRELWSTDGTLGGTDLVLNIRSGNADSNPTDLTDVGGVLYFAADGPSGIEPYRSDGTPGGTSLVADLVPGGSDSNPSGFMQAGTTVYFAATQSGIGNELFMTDGTPAGTSLVEDLQLGPGSSFPVPLGVVDGDRLIVAATANGTIDRELWITGGPISGLLQAADMNPGVFFGSDPADLIEVGSNRLIVGDDGLSGRELYRLEEFAPEIELEVIDDGTDQRSSIGSFSVTFNSIVEISGDAFEFQNLTTTETVNEDAVVTTEGGKTVVNFTFMTGPSVNAAGLLENGDYQLTIDASMVSSLGTPLDGDGDGTTGDDYVFGASALDKFYRKFGDNNGNELVDLLDFAEFRRTFGTSDGDPNWNHAFDNDGDDEIGLFDFTEFRRNFGT